MIIPDFSKNVSKEKNPEKLAKIIRKFMNVPFETQQKWICNNKEKKNMITLYFCMNGKNYYQN